MSTQTKTTFDVKLSELPIMRSFDEGVIAKKVETFRTGEKGLFWFLKLGVIIGVGYLTWTYVIPPIMVAIGSFLATAATGILAVLLILMAPAIFKGLRLFTRFIHKLLIRWDPFAQLETTRQKMLAQQTTFRVAKSNLAQLKNDMGAEKVRAFDAAEKGQKEVIRLRGKSEKIKAEMDKLIAEKGIEIKGEDVYVELASEWHKTLAGATQVAQKTKQSQEFTEKYAIRENVLKKVGQKLVMVETAMEIKLSDFDTTVEMLKKDYEFGQKANAATSAAKSVLGFSSDWERDYALEIITSTITADIAMTSGNLKDIEALTQNYNLDSDELYDNLNLIADKIQTGEDSLPDVAKYKNPDYKMTEADRVKSGGLGEMF